jgi:hypothetical protein
MAGADGDNRAAWTAVGEGLAGSRRLTPAGMAWFAAAHTLFFVSQELIWREASERS